jgi:hypothetical protein
MLMQSMSIRRTKQMQIDGQSLLNLPECTFYQHKFKFVSEEEAICYRNAEQWGRGVFSRMLANGTVGTQYSNILARLSPLN